MVLDIFSIGDPVFLAAFVFPAKVRFGFGHGLTNLQSDRLRAKPFWCEGVSGCLYSLILPPQNWHME